MLLFVKFLIRLINFLFKPYKAERLHNRRNDKIKEQAPNPFSYPNVTPNNSIAGLCTLTIPPTLRRSP